MQTFADVTPARVPRVNGTMVDEGRALAEVVRARLLLEQLERA